MAIAKNRVAVATASKKEEIQKKFISVAESKNFASKIAKYASSEVDAASRSLDVAAATGTTAGASSKIAATMGALSLGGGAVKDNVLNSAISSLSAVGGSAVGNLGLKHISSLLFNDCDPSILGDFTLAANRYILLGLAREAGCSNGLITDLMKKVTGAMELGEIGGVLGDVMDMVTPSNASGFLDDFAENAGSLGASSMVPNLDFKVAGLIEMSDMATNKNPVGAFDSAAGLLATANPIGTDPFNTAVNNSDLSELPLNGTITAMANKKSLSKVPKIDLLGNVVPELSSDEMITATTAELDEDDCSWFCGKKDEFNPRGFGEY